MWSYESVFYQIYPMGFTGAPEKNDGITVSRIKNIIDWIPHMKELGISGVYFSPVFQSDSHGYDTRDYKKIDDRLGSEEDFIYVCNKLHDSGIKIVLDGVFNHVGRGFWAFQDVLEKREKSSYVNWFHINFSGNSPYSDGFYYEGWEGHYELVKLNLYNEEVKKHIFSAIKYWYEKFKIDGLRLDVAYLLNHDFIKDLRKFTDEISTEFFLLGEMLFGDYNQLVNDNMLHSCTNYEVFKGIYSSFNDLNMYEISYSLNRQFGKENWTLYKDKHLMTFLDNHDVTRIGSVLKNKEHLMLAYGMLFTIPGIPCIYYGSEWGTLGEKSNGDNDLRPHFDKYIENDLTSFIGTLSKIRKNEQALVYGDFENIFINNGQLVYKRSLGEDIIIILINGSNESSFVSFNIGKNKGKSLISGENIEFENGILLKPYSFDCLKILL